MKLRVLHFIGAWLHAELPSAEPCSKVRNRSWGDLSGKMTERTKKEPYLVERILFDAELL